jgi:predicted DCC family thiol-disulfide oxidoreductase YuxK
VTPGGRAAEGASVVGDVVFYDGACGLCHATVRFMLLRDRAGLLTYAPIGSETWRELFPAGSAAPPSDTVSVRTSDLRVLLRSDAVAYMLSRLPGRWPLAGSALHAVPRPLRDFGYRCVAAVRRGLFAPPGDVCPVVPRHLRGRFLP